MIKTVVVINDFDYIQGGASKVAIDTANLLADSCNDIKVYFFSGNTNNKNSILDKKIIKICTNQFEALKDKNRIRGCINGIYNFKAKKQLKKLLKSLDKTTTVIHVHGWTKCLSSSVFDIAYKMKFKVVLTMHDYFTACPNGGYFNYCQNEICHLKPLSLRCIKCNCDSRNYLFKLYRVIRQEVQNKVVKLNKKLDNVISISNFSEVILKKTLPEHTNIYRIYNPIKIPVNKKIVNITNNNYYLSAGRVTKDKGVDLFCKVLTELNLKGIVVGDGDEKEILQKKYPNIKFVGWKSNEEVTKYIECAKALIFTSKLYEVAPLTPLEAMANGLPCIVSDCSAARDYIKNGINGYIYKNEKNLKEIIKEYNQLASSQYKDLSKNFIDIMKIYSYDNYLNSLKQAYKNILGENK